LISNRGTTTYFSMKFFIYTLNYACPQSFIFTNVIKKIQEVIAQNIIEAPKGSTINLNQEYSYTCKKLIITLKLIYSVKTFL
jgi:hypothetical protein